jgi:ATP-dependent metalloprotease FtsH
MLLLLTTSMFWNPFASFPALLKYSVLSVIGAAVFGALVILMEFYILISIIFPLPPRADSKAPKSFWKTWFKWAFKDPPINPKAPKTLEELIGQDSAKLEIREVVDMMMNAKKYEESGAVVPKGMLFVGPPGTGKTLFARAIANEIGIPFYVVEGGSISGLIFGLGVVKLKTLFAKLRKHEKCILFIDEIDSMGQRRMQDQGFGAVTDMNMTLNTLLTEMDGFHASNLMVIGATNNDGILDPALMRAGRMDRRIYFQMPNPEERKNLFKYYLEKVKCDDAIDFDALSMLTAQSSPADIANIVNEGALISQRPGGPGIVTTEVLKMALERAEMGAERSIVGTTLEITNPDPTIRLDHVMGIDDLKIDAIEVVDFLRKGEKLRDIGAKVPKGVLLIGPPGVGKTLLAKAIANEAGVPFYGISASHLQGMFRGEGAARIRALYSQARKSPASIVFIDEIDAIAGTMQDIGNRRTPELNQILVELDGLHRTNVITIVATNMEQNLDPAFGRSGRFDRKIYIGLPDKASRRQMFELYLKQVQLHSDYDLDELAKLSVNFSGADIAATVNEAAILAVRNGKSKVEQPELEEAIDKVSVTSGSKMNTSGISLARTPDLDVRLDDIKGMEEAKAEAAEVVAMLKHAELISKSGLKPAKGILLVGRPGTGKTMLAKAIANEAGVPFYALSGSDFVQIWVGLGAQRVRAVYEQARRSGKPAIVFIDEIDALGHARGIDRGAGGKQEHNQTLNQFLVELDGFGKHKVLTIGATNNATMLDPALLRPGRFDRKIHIPLPSLEGREAILESYLNKTKLEKKFNTLELARMTVFSAGAELANIVNEAGLMAVRDGRLIIEQEDMIKAVQRVKFGAPLSRQILLDELTATAYHEAGHAIVCYYRNRKDRIQITTVVPSGGALGYMWPVSKDEYNHTNKHEYLVDIEVSLGGHAAENLHMETTTSGVSSDLRQVAGVASAMIRDWGMGSFKFNTDLAFSYTYYNNMASPETQREIELEIKNLVDKCYANVQDLLRAKRAELDRLAMALVEKETLYYKDIVHILEPDRSDEEIQRDIDALADRKLVGRPPVVNIETMAGLAGLAGLQGGSVPPPGGPNGGGSGNSPGPSGNPANNQDFRPELDDKGQRDFETDFDPPYLE